MPAIPLRALEEDLARLAGLLARARRERLTGAQQQDLARASGVVASLRQALRARRPDGVDQGQERLELPVVLYRPEDRFDCPTLGCRNLTVGVCVARQVATDAQRTEQASRGQGTDYPHCDTRKCALGRSMREALEPSSATAWRGSGPGGRFQRERSRAEKRRQVQARKHQERNGLGLRDRVPSIDVEPEEVEG